VLAHSRACRQTPGADCPHPGNQIRREAGHAERTRTQARRPLTSRRARAACKTPSWSPSWRRGPGTPEGAHPKSLAPFAHVGPLRRDGVRCKGDFPVDSRAWLSRMDGGHPAERPRAAVAGFPLFSCVSTVGLWRTREDTDTSVPGSANPFSLAHMAVLAHMDQRRGFSNAWAVRFAKAGDFPQDRQQPARSGQSSVR
jgi:hypothetical protein